MAALSTGTGEKARRVWPVEKYARLVSDTQSSVGGSTSRKNEGIWQHYSSKEGGIHLAVIDSSHLMISSGTMIFESFSLWDAKKWLKIVTRGDSAMFVYKVKSDNRRFRVKFLPLSSPTNAVETCRDFATFIAPLVPIREMEGAISTRDKDTSTRDKSGSLCGIERDSQFVNYGDDFDCSQIVSETQIAESQQMNVASSGAGPILVPDESSLIPIPDIGKLVQTQGKSLGRAYVDTNLPTEQLGQFVRLCLTDANFPAFVEAVEKELNSMTS